MKITTSTDPRGIGILALQHKDYDKATGNPLGAWDLHHRATLLAARVIDRNDTGLVGLGHWIYDPETVGDINGGQLLDYDKRSIPMWRFATPSVVVMPDSASIATPSGSRVPGADTCATLSGFSINSIEDDKYKADERLKKFTPFLPQRDGKSMWPKIPVDFFGISLAANKESKQLDLYFPTDPRLVAVNRKGDALMGSLVCDMGDGFKTDLDRMARLQAMMRVIKKPVGCIGFPKDQNSIAWNIGPSGCGDVHGGLVFEKRAGTPSSGTTTTGDPVATGPTALPGGVVGGGQNLVPFGIGPEIPPFRFDPGLLAGGGAGSTVVMPAPDSAVGIIGMVSKFDSGPFDVGQVGDQHKIGQDDDGHPIHANHLSTNSYFRRDNTYDGPLEFNGNYVDPIQGCYLVPTFLRWDSRPSHPFVCGPRKGLWRWESMCYFKATITTSGGIPTPTGLEGLLPSSPPPNPLFGPSGGGGGSDGGWGGSGIVPPPPQDLRGILPVRQWTRGNPFDPYVSTDVATSFPALLFRPQNLANNAPDLRKFFGLVPASLSKYLDLTSPLTGRIEAFGSHSATGIWNYNQQPKSGRFPGGTSSGGLVLMPPEFDMADASSSFSRAGITSSTTYLVAAPGAYFGAAIPVTTTGGLKTGYRWGVDSSGNVNFDFINSSGTITSNVLRLNSSGVPQAIIGTSASLSSLKGTASSSSTSVGNVGAGEDNLKTYTLPANAFSTTNSCLHVVGHGNLVTGSTITVKFYFGSASTTLMASSTISPASWSADIYVTRTGNNTQNIKIKFFISNVASDFASGSSAMRVIDATATETDSGTITVKFTGQSSSANDNDVVQDLMLTQFYNAP